MCDTPLSIVLNPRAARGRAARRVADVIRCFRDTDFEFEVVESRAPGDIERWFSQTKVPRAVVAGGDGSVHEAVNGLLARGADRDAGPMLGVLPLGTGNDFAKACGVSLDGAEAAMQLAERLAKGSPARAVDAGRVNERYFANGCGIGFDARVAARASRVQLPIGDAVYGIALGGAILKGLATPSIDLSFDGKRISGPALLVNLANGPFEGGRFHIAPGALNDDGWLELVHAGPVSIPRLATLLPAILRGRHVDEPEVTTARVKRCRIESASPLPWHLDGEVQPDASHFDIAVLPGALRLL